jgi:hypothetical protein
MRPDGELFRAGPKAKPNILKRSGTLKESAADDRPPT